MADPWTHRQLCDDGACTGVIGAEGRCNACGRVAQHWGDECRRGLRDAEDAEEAEEEAGLGSAAVSPRVVGPALAAAPDDFERRTLCPDGACVGVLDARGVCGVCGARGDDAAEDDDADDDDADDDADDDDPDDDDADDDAANDDADDDDDQRALCPDGACVGLLDARGTCKVCGLTREPRP